MVAPKSYLNLDLAIERAEGGYRARVLSSPAGEAASEFAIPFSPLEIENFLLRIGRRRATRRLETSEVDAAKAFGGRLYAAVFGQSLGRVLSSSIDEASRREAAGLRIRLRLRDAPELIDLPWEFLYNPELNRFLSLSIQTPVVRYLDLPERIRPLVIRPPLRILVMISSPHDLPPLSVHREWEKLSDALGDLRQRGLVDVDRLDDATLPVLQHRLLAGEYPIFHFVGHGVFDERAQDGMLALEDEAGRSRLVSGQYLGALFHDHRALRLAVLNACEGARTSRSDPFGGVAQSLMQQGVPAVVAMQFEVTDEAAIAFAHRFYEVLADGHLVDTAVAEARKAIFGQGNEIEWGTPVLYLRSPEGQIFDLERVEETVSAPRPTEPREGEAARLDRRREARDAPVAERSPDRPTLGAAATTGPEPAAGAWAPKDYMSMMIIGTLCLCLIVAVMIISLGVLRGTMSPDLLLKAVGVAVGGGLLALFAIFFKTIKVAKGGVSRL